MTNANTARRAHEVLDGMFAGRILSRENEQLLRSFLPELPKQKTLEDLRRDVYDVWAGTNDNEWPDDMHCDLETWLYELHAQLKGVEDESAPALPAGMRIAEHENFGRVVVSPGVGIDRCHEIFYLDPGMSSGTDISEVEPDSLTFIDAEPAHPEFLETEADYQKAPEGTIVALDGSGTIWLKKFGGWRNTAGDHGVESACIALDSRRVLRWGNE